jgi:hypothetical protein
MKVSGRGLIEGTMLAFAWRDREKSRKISVMLARIRAEI